MNLATDLSNLNNGMYARMPKQQANVISKSIEDFVHTWNPANAINVGQPFPDFSVTDTLARRRAGRTVMGHSEKLNN